MRFGSRASARRSHAILRTLKRNSGIISAVARLYLKGGRRAVGFDVMSIGEVQFYGNVLQLYASRHAGDLIYIFHHQATWDEFDTLFPALRGRVIHVRARQLNRSWFRKLDLYITCEQFVSGPPTVYTVTLFHGQPSKGVTFRFRGRDALMANDALFLYGPLQRQALQEHVEYWGLALPPHLSVFDIGYTKSDDLINGKFDREQSLMELGLDPGKKTVLYAPAFNEGASLRECGLEILETLCSLKQFNILAKLPIDCLRPVSDFKATGGVDWFKTIGRLEQEHANFRLVRSFQADSALAAADLLITCVSSIGFEFLAIRRPVIYIDTPKFFAKTLTSFFPRHDLSSWSQRTTVNGGREFGLVIHQPRELSQAIAEVFAHPEWYPKRKSDLPHYLLYNPGKATEAAVNQIAKLLAQKVRSHRPADQVHTLLLQLSEYVPLRSRIKRKVQSLLLTKPKMIITRLLNRYDYTLTKTGLCFVDAKSTIAAARQKGLSVCEYRESLEDDSRKKGRRDLIVNKLKAAGVLDDVATVCEIGAGTGQYLEKVMTVAQPESYEVYETDQGWVKFLKSEYGGRNGCTLICHPADGKTLRYTPSGSIDLVHAHGVFVYLPLLQTMEYLKESVRVLRPGGHIVFDVYLDTTFSSLSVVEDWLAGPHRFPVVIPGKLLQDFACVYELRTMEAFSMIHGSGTVDYLIWQKALLVAFFLWPFAT